VLELEVQSGRRTELIDVTGRVQEAVAGTTAGMATLFVPHTTAGIVLQASGEGVRHVAADLEAALERLVDESGPWAHVAEGDRNPWSHVRAALTASSLTVPLDCGELSLGEHQAIFLCEFDGPRSRRLLLALHE
jgi:secondary thiamine-phosphate synthase enzyme